MLKDGERHYRITSVGPDKIKKERMHVLDFTVSVTDFLNEHFRGAMSVYVEGMPFGYAEVSPDGLAYFIKLLLIEILGEHMLHASITCSQRQIRIDVNAGGRTLELDWALHIAEKSGFSLTDEGDGKYVLTAPVIPERRPSVYAHSRREFYFIMRDVFLL